MKWREAEGEKSSKFARGVTYRGRDWNLPPSAWSQYNVTFSTAMHSHSTGVVEDEDTTRLAVLNVKLATVQLAG